MLVSRRKKRRTRFPLLAAPAVMGQPIFLLNDEFRDTLAAGAINGTVAPGVGTTAQRTRNVTDTTAILSMANGLLVNGNPHNANGDPGLWYGGYARALGRSLLVKHIHQTSQGLVVAWDANQAGAGSYGLRINGTEVIQASNASATFNSNVGLAVENTTYTLAVILRANGYYGLIKGGPFTNWTLLWVSSTNSDATIYPSLTGEAGVGPGQDGFARIPKTALILIPLAYDAFGRANGALGSTETSGPDGASQPTPARVWTGPTWTIATNKAVNTPTLGAEQATGALVVGTWYIITATQVDYFYAGCAVGDVFVATATTALDANNKVKAYTTAELLASFDAGKADIIAGVDIVGTAQYMEGSIVNLDSAATPLNYIHAYLGRNLGAGATRIMLDEVVAGVRTNKITVTNATYVSGARLVIVRDGTSCALYYNNVQVGTTQTMTANTNTRMGVSSAGGATATHDAVLVMPRGKNGEYAILNKYTRGG